MKNPVKQSKRKLQKNSNDAQQVSFINDLPQLNTPQNIKNLDGSNKKNYMKVQANYKLLPKITTQSTTNHNKNIHSNNNRKLKLSFFLLNECKYPNRNKNLISSLDISKLLYKSRPPSICIDYNDSDAEILVNDSEDEGLMSIRQMKCKDLEYLNPNREQSQKLQASKLIQAQNAEASYENYINSFHNLERYTDIQDFYELNSNINQEMQKYIQQHKLLPKRVRLIDNKQHEEMDASGQLLSESYLHLFIKGISCPNYNNLKVLKLRNNEIDGQKVNRMFECFPISLVNLDLSDNFIGIQGIQSLCTFIQFKNSNLKILNLENNLLGDDNFALLFQLIQDNKLLSSLNLSKNNISCASMVNISKFLQKSPSLQELYLHYNCIGQNGGKLLFRGLLRNQYLRVLDLSFNCLGNHNNHNDFGVQALYELLHKPHPALQHLDISYNGYTNGDAKIIQKSLQFNQILYGFHFNGNATDYQVNPRGSLINQTEYNLGINRRLKQYRNISNIMTDNLSFLTQKVDLINLPRITSCNPIPKKFEINQQDCCWICQGWCEVVFIWTPGVSGSLSEEPVFLHLDFEDWRPMIMNLRNNIFEVRRMCPPNETIKYFFSNPSIGVQVNAKDQQCIEMKPSEIIRTHGVPLLYADSTFTISNKMNIVNYIDALKQNTIIDSSKHFVCNVNAKPRQPEKIWDIDPSKAINRKWTVESSFFNNYQPDTDVYLDQCLDFDLGCGKLLTFLQEDKKQDLKVVLRKYYKKLIQVFNFYASINMDPQFPTIDFKLFMDCMKQIKIHNKKQRMVDIEISFLSTHIAQKERNFIYVKDQCLIRYQFIECFIRIAIGQFQKKYSSNDVGQFIENLIQQDKVLEVIAQFGDQQEWRNVRYWTQIMDMTISNYIHIYQQEYKMQVLLILFDYACRMTPKRKFNYVTMTDFLNFFIKANLCDDDLNEKDIYLIYLQSMMTQVNQVTNNRHIQMSFIEFTEGITRVAEKLSPSSPCHTEKNPSYRVRLVLPLFVKFEGLLFILYMRLKSFLIELYGTDHELFSFQSKIIRKTVLGTLDAKKQGVYENHSDSDENSSATLRIDNDDKFCTSMKHIQWNEKIIAQLLQRNPNKEYFLKNLLSSDALGDQFIDSPHDSANQERDQRAIGKWDHIRQQIHNREQFAQIQGMGTSKLLKNLNHFQRVNELIDSAEILESTPLTLIAIQKRQIKRKTFNKSIFNVDAKYFDEEQD